MNTRNIYLQCQTSGGAVNIMLPRITTVSKRTTVWGFRIFINDEDGNAAANNISITPHPADTINGNASPVVLNIDGVTGDLQIVGTEKWTFNSGAGGGTGDACWEHGSGVESCQQINDGFPNNASGDFSISEGAINTSS